MFANGIAIGWIKSVEIVIRPNTIDTTYTLDLEVG
jgi:hypothetical protein